MCAQSAAPPKRPTEVKGPKRNGLPPGILVDRQIRLAREKKLLQIDPFEEEFLEPATYDLRVGERAAVTTSSRPINLAEVKMLTLEPGAMAILQSLEVLTLSSHIVGRIGPKSMLLRRGVIAATGPQIDPGFHGRLIVNLINLSPRTFVLRYGAPFLSVEFHYLSEPPEHPYAGEYQDRTELSAEELEILFAYQSPTLAEIHRGFAEIRDNLRETAGFRRDFTRFEEDVRSGIGALQTQMAGLRTAESPAEKPVSLTIAEFGTSDYEAVKPIPVTVRNEDGSFVASFFEANIHAAGETDQEAYDNLRSLILDMYDSVAESEESSLAPPLQTQRGVLRTYVRKIGE